MGLDSAIQHLLKAKRISAPSQSYAKDNPAEWAKVKAYLEGGPRPVGVTTEMGLGLVEVEDARRPAPPPVGDKLRYAPPTLSNPVVFDLTNANRGSGILGSGQGRDLVIKCKEVLTGPMLLMGWRHIVWIGGEFNTPASVSGEAQLCIIQACTGTVHIEGLKGRTAGATDFFPLRWGGPSHIVQFQNCDLQVTHAGTNAHADIFQTQEARIASFRVDRCSLHTNYQGFFCSNEATSHSSGPAQVSEARISRTNFKTVNGADGIWLFKALPSRTALLPGPWYLEDVWAPSERVYPTTAFIDWTPKPSPYGCYRRQDAISSYLEWAPVCEINGKLRIGSPTNYCAADAGMSYVSPGYL